MAQALAGQSDSESEWIGGAPELQAAAEQIVRTDSESSNVSNDFWVPTVTGDGQVRSPSVVYYCSLTKPYLLQVFYVNTKTGEHSRDLPLEADSEISDSDLAGLAAQQRSRAGTTASLGLVHAVADVANGSAHSPTAGFGLPKRAGTPEPWQRRLADDGMTYYWLNRSDGSISWTRPEAPASTPTTLLQHQNGHAHEAQAASPYRNNAGTNAEDAALASAGYTHGREGVFHVPGRLRSDTTGLAPRNTNGVDRSSVYSDDSDIVPREERIRTTSTSSGDPIPIGAGSNGHSLPKSPSVELTGAEKSAKALQEALAPPFPTSVSDLSVKAQEAIRLAVGVTRARARGPEHDREVEDRVSAVVLAVRNLLYVAALPSGHVPNIGSNGRLSEIRANAASQSVQSQLKPAQRKVTATLSKLVLSARAVYYDSLTSTADNGGRIEADALELDKALVAFVSEVERCKQRHSTVGFKRVVGAFSPSGLGLGLIGGGAAGTWKGYGWVPLDDSDDMPSRILSQAIIKDLRNHVQKLADRLEAFASALHMGTLSPGKA
jgi:son of sevenless